MEFGYYRRRYERVPVDQPVTVTLLSNPEVRFAGRLVNWSGRGACVEIGTALPSGSLIKIEVEDTMLLGEAVHSRKEGERFEIGVKLEHVLYQTRELAKVTRRLLGEEAAAEFERTAPVQRLRFPC